MRTWSKVVVAADSCREGLRGVTACWALGGGGSCADCGVAGWCGGSSGVCDALHVGSIAVEWQCCTVVGSSQVSQTIQVSWLERNCSCRRWCRAAGAVGGFEHARGGAERGLLRLGYGGRVWTGRCGVGSSQLTASSFRCQQ